MHGNDLKDNMSNFRFPQNFYPKVIGKINFKTSKNFGVTDNKTCVVVTLVKFKTAFKIQ